MAVDDDGFDYGEPPKRSKSPKQPEPSEPPKHPELPFGTNPHFLHRRDDPDTSESAAYSIDTKKYERAVLAVIDTFEDIGCISDQVRHVFPAKTPYSTVTARYKALDDAGYIRRIGDKRPGESGNQQQVMRITSLGRSALSQPIQEKPKRKRKPKPDAGASNHPTPG